MQERDRLGSDKMTIFSVQGLDTVSLDLTAQLRLLGCFFNYQGDFIYFSATDSARAKAQILLKQNRIPFTEREPHAYADADE